jgi:uroporphyrinogen-III synthase
VLFPCATGARDVVPRELGARGWQVDEVVVYRTVPADPPDAALAAQLHDADAVVFASPSAVTAFAAMTDGGGSPLAMPSVVVCIGSTTAAAAAEVGCGHVLTAGGPSVDELLGALESGFGSAGVPGPAR